VRARAWLAVLGALAACATAPERRAVPPSVVAPAGVLPPFDPAGPRLVYAVDFAHAWESRRSHDELVARTVDVLRRRVDGLFKGGVVRRAGDGVEVLLPQGDPAPLEVYRRIARQPGRFQVHLVDGGSEFMAALARRVRDMSPAGTLVTKDRWHGPGGTPQSEDDIITADDGQRLTRVLDDLTAATPVPADRQILLESWHSEFSSFQWRTFYVVKDAAIDNADVAAAEIAPAGDGQPAIRMVLTADGRRKFADLTARTVGRKLALVVDGTVRSAPVLMSPISGGVIFLMISGDPAAPREQLEDLVVVLRSGPLPAPLSLVKEEEELVPARASGASSGDRPAGARVP
jgi:preprotein translocase subunit SecD